MAKYNTENIKNLYWANNAGFKRGRDPMGIQNCSIVIYGILLPGLTNQTERLRYYSFYCWLLYEYEKECEKTTENGTLIDLYNYIRRAELTMAFLMDGRGIKSVVGSQHISQQEYGTTKEGYYDIKSSADLNAYPSQKKYWANPTGAFGQNYLGSLVYLELVENNEGSIVLKNRGRYLAESFINSVDEKSRNLFLQYVRKGCLPPKDIARMESLCLDKIIHKSQEWSLLNDIITNEDLNGSTFRKDTISLMLDTYRKGVEIEQFPKTMFLKYESGSSETVLGWHYYYLCEALHYSIETIFWMILDNASKNNYLPIGDFMSLCANCIISGFSQSDSSKKLSETMTMFKSSKEEIVERLNNLISLVNDDDSKKASSKAVELLVCIYKIVMMNREVYFSFENNHKINLQFGNANSFAKRYVGNNIDLKVDAFVRNVIFNTPNLEVKEKLVTKLEVKV